MLKDIVNKQYRDKINKAVSKTVDIIVPPEGWICTARKALGISAVQLATRLGVSRDHISQTEKRELNGSVSLKTLQSMAEGMGCRLVYAIVPKRNVEDILKARARGKATLRVKEAQSHMALEDQAISEKQVKFEIDRLTKEILKDHPPDFWSDE
jgi:predicted DNA-binding mobile mystery protein A